MTGFAGGPAWADPCVDAGKVPIVADTVLRVLIIDGRAARRDLMTRLLCSRGYAVDLAKTIAEAQAMQPLGYDLLLVNEHLSDGRGADLIAALADQDPAVSRRCVLTSGGLYGDVPPGTVVVARPFDLAGRHR